jgi:Protein of unknown function (DUF3108)
VSFRRPTHRTITLAVAAAALVAAFDGRAFAETRLDARYTATLAGVPIGRGLWQVEIADNQFTAIASGKTSGLLAVFSGGHGTAASSGSVKAGILQAASYASSVVSGKKTDDVRMALSGGVVKNLSAEPPMPPVPDRVPVTEAHMRGVIDPMTGGLLATSGTGDTVTPEACHRTLPIFDGRGRFDLILSFKRMERVKAEQGYEGPVVVCNVHYHPIAGHRPNRAAIRYLMEARDIEVWYAPVAGTRILVPFRISVPTVLGTAVLEADTFVATGRAGRAGAAPTSVKTQ